MTPGRAWTGTEKLSLTTHSYLVSDLLDTDAAGIPVMIGGGYGGIGQSAYGFAWSDSGWTVRWRFPHGTAYIRSAGTRPGQKHLIWAGIEAGFGDYGLLKPLLMARVDDRLVVHYDTVTYIEQSRYPYAGAVSLTRRWAVVSDQATVPPFYLDLRLLYSDTVESWKEVEVAGFGREGVAVAPLDDTTALVVWAGGTSAEPDGSFERMRWGVLRGDKWFPSAERVDDGLLDAAPMLRPRPSGGYWLGWVTHDRHLIFRTFRDGAWAVRDTLDCAYRTGDPYSSQSIDISRDGGEYPAASWMAWNNRRGGWTICASVPTDSGLGVADHLEGTEDGLGPTVARDVNGDVWIAWWKMWDGIFWRHTYTTATSGAPRVSGAGKHRLVSWTLSEPAPETWWAVLRARGDGEFEVAARVRAGPGEGMSWTDTSPPAGVLRYRIRRECVDRRYEWLSADSRWPVRSHKPLQLRVLQHPAEGRAVFEVADAQPGALIVQLFDLQGRVILSQQLDWAAADPHMYSVELPGGPGRMAPGVYFLRVTDATGQASPVVKLVLLR